MGDRASISFKYDDDESVVLCDHWGGEEFLEETEAWAKRFIREHPPEKHISTPITRLEPNTLMVLYIQDLGYDESRSLYLGKTTEDVDNSDCGHKTIDLKELKQQLN